MIETTSILGANKRVRIDPYSLNPLADDVKQVAPDQYAALLRKVGPPPKLFTGGASDVPAFTASGADPRSLLTLPYGYRHHAASVRSLADLHQIFEDYTNEPMLSISHEGLSEAKARMLAWVRGDWTPAVTSRPQPWVSGVDRVTPSAPAMTKGELIRAKMRARYGDGSSAPAKETTT